jgi:hypothetical protein
VFTGRDASCISHANLMVVQAVGRGLRFTTAAGGQKVRGSKAHCQGAL